MAQFLECLLIVALDHAHVRPAQPDPVPNLRVDELVRETRQPPHP